MEKMGRAVELCCGLGGMGLGFARLGVEICAGFDLWEQAVSVYRHNVVGAKAEVLDLVDPSSPKRMRQWLKEAAAPEIVLAGPPCKGVSRLRNGNHDETHNQVVEALPQFIAALRPRIVLVENVPELRTHRKGQVFKVLLDGLRNPARRLRYSVDVAEYDAAQHGTPQVRRRLFVLAVRGGSARLPCSDRDLSDLYRALRRGLRPDPKHEDVVESFRDTGNTVWVTSKQALSDLPLLGPGEPEAVRAYASEPETAYQSAMRARGNGNVVTGTQTPRVLPTTVERLRFIPMGGCAADLPGEIASGLNRRYYSSYRRLHPDAPATTLNTRYDCVYHHHLWRSLSVREYARLQGIPDHFEFPASLLPRRSAYELIGNSVPPPLMEWLGGEILGTHG